jgi:CubicO group peptidase (beta-lactamase class C family)
MQIISLLFVPFTFGQNGIPIIDSIMTAAHNEGKLNGNVLIAEKGQIVYNRSFGYANEATKEKLNENSVFCLASVSKQFTAMAIVMLKEQGKLNYDDKITKYFPELTAYDNITIRNLLNHTSGLIPEMEQLLNTKEVQEYLSTRLIGNTATNKDIIAFLSIYKPKLRFTPNTKFEYCNTGYFLLASVIEKVSGVTYAEYLDKVIFKPLEMNHTFNYSPDLLTDTIKNYTYDYMYSESLKKYCLVDSLKVKNTLKGAFYGGGSLYSTVLDLLKWDRALYTEKLVSFSSLKEIFDPPVLTDNTKTDYGFGWLIREDPIYGKSVYHDGSHRGYATYIDRNIDHDKTIIILENHNQGVFPVYIINHILYNVYLPKEVQLSKQQLDELCGTYEVQKGLNLRIWSENGKIYCQLTGQSALQLFAENEMMLFSKAVEDKLQFEKNKQGKITCLYILQKGGKIRAGKK